MYLCIFWQYVFTYISSKDLLEVSPEATYHYNLYLMVLGYLKWHEGGAHSLEKVENACSRVSIVACCPNWNLDLGSAM